MYTSEYSALVIQQVGTERGTTTDNIKKLVTLEKTSVSVPLPFSERVVMLV